MILFDTTVLCYAVGEPHPLREPCRSLLDWHGEGSLHAATTIEVVQEFAHVRARRRSRADAVQVARHYAAALTLLTAAPDDLDLGLSLYQRHEDLGAFDAVLAAVTINQGLDALVSADNAFARVPSLRWIDPRRPNLRRLVAS